MAQKTQAQITAEIASYIIDNTQGAITPAQMRQILNDLNDSLLNVAGNTQNANTVFSGPDAGGPAAPSFRALVGADLPTPTTVALGGVKAIVAITSRFITSITTAGQPVLGTVSSTDIADSTTVGRAVLTAANAAAARSAIGSGATGDALFIAASAAAAKTTLALDQVDNTSDVNKPVSTAQAAAIAAAAAGVLYPLGTLNGLTVSRATATTFGVATGNARNDDGGTGANMLLASAFTKSLSAWAVGTGNGGLDTGAVAASTWYHIHLIRKTSDGSLDVLYSLSPTAPTMPSGYVARCLLESFKTDGASQITAFLQVGDFMLLNAAVVDIDATNPGTAAVTATLASIPTGRKVEAILSVGTYFGTNNYSIVASSLDVSDQAPQTVTTAALSGFSSGGGVSAGTAHWEFVAMNIPTNTSAQVRYRISASGAADHVGIISRGWKRIRSQ